MLPADVAGRIDERRAAGPGIIAGVVRASGQADHMERADGTVNAGPDVGFVDKTSCIGDDAQFTKKRERRALTVPAGVDIFPIGAVLLLGLVMHSKATAERFALRSRRLNAGAPVFSVGAVSYTHLRA